MSYWFGDGSMHRRRSTTQEEESHMAKIIHFHWLVKVQGSQHSWPPQKQLWEKKKRIPTIFSGLCILPWMVFEPLWIINSQLQGDDVIASWKCKLWVSRHLNMSSIFCWTSGLQCCHSCQNNSKHTQLKLDLVRNCNMHDYNTVNNQYILPVSLNMSLFLFLSALL